jgi:tryptophan 2,3-dioxygenase
MERSMYYADYLQLEKILGSQHPESDKEGKNNAHDEMLFIIIHQAYELWFKQILFEVDSVAAIMNKPAVNDNSPELQIIVHRLQRVVTILKVLVHQIDIMETMTPMDFLDFRDMLRPASGFQSWQFKVLEAKLGLKYEQRHGQDYYTSHLRNYHVDIIKEVEKQTPLLLLLNTWLERMPFFEEVLWNEYKKVYIKSLAEAEKDNISFFEEVFINRPAYDTRQLSPNACRNALFIMAYRGYPMLELPWQILNTLLEIDEQLGTWRYRHMNMVKRMIGTRIGTGGSSGAGYLKAAMDKHYIFNEIAQLTSFLLERRNLPVLPDEVSEQLGFKNY